MAVKIGFVGSGGIAGNHMRQLVTLDNAQMVAFCDVVQDRAEAAARQYGGTAYTDYREMYERESLDAVFVCVPPFAHADQEVLAAERGLALFVEKPVAVTLKKAEEIAAAIEKHGVVSSVGYHFRYMASTQKAKEVLGDQEVGFAQGSWIGGMPGVHWWRVLGESGGQMVEQTTHIFDLARYILGEVTSVHATARTGLMSDVEDYDVHDATVTDLTFRNGTIASITSACIVSAGGRVGLDLYTKEMTLRIGSGNLEILRPGRTEIIQSGNAPYLEEDRAFLAAAESGDRSGILSTYADAVKTLRVTLSANRSISEGTVIGLE